MEYEEYEVVCFYCGYEFVDTPPFVCPYCHKSFEENECDCLEIE